MQSKGPVMSDCLCLSRRQLLRSSVAGSAAAISTAIPLAPHALAAVKSNHRGHGSPLHSDEHLTFDQVWVTPKGTPLGGDVHVELYRDGRTYVKFHAHCSSIFGSFDFTLRAYVSAPNAPAIAFLHSGHVSGVDSSDHDEWGHNPLVSFFYDTIAAQPGYSVVKDYTWAGIVGAAEQLFADLLDLGAGVIGATLGVVLAATREATDWLNTTLGPGGTLAVISGFAIFAVGALQGANLAASLIAATVEGVGIGLLTEALVDHRKLNDAELALARQVFGDTINYSKVRLTNLSGFGKRPFTVPGADGKTYVNIGPGFSDASTYTKPNYPIPGQLLIHELTHAWQIEHSDFLPGWMCHAVINQANNSFVESAYKYGGAGPAWSSFNWEQQGSIVDDWFGAQGNSQAYWPMDQESPYYDYIWTDLLNHNPAPTAPANLRASSSISVSRMPNLIDVFYPTPDGSLGTSWMNGQWNAPFTVAGPGSAAPGAVACLGRMPFNLDIYWAGPDGSVFGVWWNNKWNDRFTVAGAGSAMPGSVAATCQNPNHIDIFWVQPDGSVGTGWWDIGPGWGTPYTITPPGVAANGVAAVARLPGHLDVFYVTPWGEIGSTWWDASNVGWAPPFTLSPRGSALPGSGSVATACRLQNHIDVFYVGTDGSVMTTWWSPDTGWNAPFSIAPSGSSNGAVSAVSRTPTSVDVVWIAADGSVGYAGWNAATNNGAWRAPFTIAPAGSAAPTSVISLLGRLPVHLDVFWVTPGGAIGSVWWDGFVNGGKWNPFFTTTGDGTALVPS